MRPGPRPAFAWDAPAGTASVILLALVIRLAPFPVVAGLLPRLSAAGIAEDGEAFYLPLARSLAHTGEFAMRPGVPYARHTPLYPAVLAGLERLGMLSGTSIALLQALLGAAALVLIVLWVRPMSGPWPALGAFLLAALLPDFAAYSYLNLTENMSVVLVLAALVGFQRALAGGGPAWWAGVGVLLGLAALTREFCITLLAPLALWSFRSLTASRAASRVAVMVASSALVILPWTIRNYRLFGEVIPLSDKGAGNVYLGTLKGKFHPSDARRNWKLDDPRQAEVHRQLEQRLAEARTPSERDRLYLRAAWQNLTDDPAGQVAYLFRKAQFFWQANIGMRHARRIGLPAVMALSEALYWLCLLGAVAGSVGAGADGRWRLFLWMLVGWIFAFHLVVGEAEPRYHFLALPPLFALVARGLAAWLPAGARDGAPRSRTDVPPSER